MQAAQLSGEIDSHIVYRGDAKATPRYGLTAACWQAFDKLRQAALREGFDLQIASAFRDAARQQRIWDGKALGQRPVLDKQCRPLDISCLSELEKLEAIMRWSALPCTSRHHWGTDLDIFDAAAIDADYQLQLVVDEYRGNGPFAAMTQWLDDLIARGQAQGFFKPYARDRGGVAPEPWHLSFAPQALCCQQAMPPEAMLAAISARKPQLYKTVQQHWAQLYPRFIAVPETAYPSLP